MGGDGFERRFGLYHVDFDTKRRMPKLSASFYRETIRAKRSGLIRNSSILAQAPTHRLVDHRFQVQLDPSTLCGRHHHEDSQHLVRGVDEIETAAGAVLWRGCRGLVALFGMRPSLWGGFAIAALGLPLMLSSHLADVLAGMVSVGVGTFFAQACATGFVGQAARRNRGVASGTYLACVFFCAHRPLPSSAAENRQAIICW